MNKKIEEIKTFCKRVWLNKESSESTGSVVAWHGRVKYRDGKPDDYIFFEVGDCSYKARLHKTSSDTILEFINKIKLLSKTASEFAEFLEVEYNL